MSSPSAKPQMKTGHHTNRAMPRTCHIDTFSFGLLVGMVMSHSGSINQRGRKKVAGLLNNGLLNLKRANRAQLDSFMETLGLFQPPSLPFPDLAMDPPPNLELESERREREENGERRTSMRGERRVK